MLLVSNGKLLLLLSLAGWWVDWLAGWLVACLTAEFSSSVVRSSFVTLVPESEVERGSRTRMTIAEEEEGGDDRMV